MNVPPFRTSSGDIGCPRCTTPLKKGKAPFYIRGEKVGIFDAIVCPICNYSALTEKGYEEAISEAKKIGIVGIVEDIPELAQLELILGQYKKDSNKLSRIIIEDQPAESSTWITEEIMNLQQPATISHFTKKNLSRTR